jgi:hypothetical protein
MSANDVQIIRPVKVLQQMAFGTAKLTVEQIWDAAGQVRTVVRIKSGNTMATELNITGWTLLKTGNLVAFAADGSVYTFFKTGSYTKTESIAMSGGAWTRTSTFQLIKSQLVVTSSQARDARNQLRETATFIYNPINGQLLYSSQSISSGKGTIHLAMYYLSGIRYGLVWGQGLNGGSVSLPLTISTQMEVVKDPVTGFVSSVKGVSFFQRIELIITDSQILLKTTKK